MFLFFYLLNPFPLLFSTSFSNASGIIEVARISSLYINNKEVQSIITNNNVVLYEKAVTPIPIPETITLNASKDIISYAHNESCTLTLQYPPGYTINIYNNSTNVLLGTMTDNNNNTYQYNLIVLH